MSVRAEAIHLEIFPNDCEIGDKDGAASAEQSAPSNRRAISCGGLGSACPAAGCRADRAGWRCIQPQPMLGTFGI